MWEDHHRTEARAYRKRQKWWLMDLRKRKPELFTPGSELEAELNKEKDEEPPRKKTLSGASIARKRKVL
jgi:hypothetical protein